LNLGSVFTILVYYAAWIGNWLTFRKKYENMYRNVEVSLKFRVNLGSYGRDYE